MGNGWLQACLRNVQLKRQAEEAEVARLAAEQLELNGSAQPPMINGSQANGLEAPIPAAAPPVHQVQHTLIPYFSEHVAMWVNSG